MAAFFSSNNVKEQIEMYIQFLEKTSVSNEFQGSRNNYCASILTSMLKHPLEWSESTDFNIRLIGGRLISELNERGADNKSIDFVFSILFRFLMELYFNQANDLSLDMMNVKNFAFEQKDSFTEQCKRQIDYATQEMAFSLFRDKYHRGDIQHFIKAAESEKSIEAKLVEWDKKTTLQLEKVEALKAKLDEQETAYNFVGLHKGFHNLSRAKRVEAKAALFNTRLFGFLTIVPLIFEIIVLTINSNGTWLDAFRIALIPAFALTFILAYYFRVSLSNYQSIKSQIVQIELRKSLCTFIQNYSVYAEKMTDKESLRKFENVVFSNIMPSEDKIPSTFDGVEQIAKLIESVKK
ncbi:hypothetical protein WCU79_14800 [Pectobacterium versatile]|uniref:Uncharacterized protein n=1 Tax=Pectobacterium versatile TaxID=2488639 RepID=A0ABU8K5W2_9GAMM